MRGGRAGGDEVLYVMMGLGEVRNEVQAVMERELEGGKAYDVVVVVEDMDVNDLPVEVLARRVVRFHGSSQGYEDDDLGDKGSEVVLQALMWGCDVPGLLGGAGWVTRVVQRDERFHDAGLEVKGSLRM
jgi:hypothetical protein